MIVGEGYARLGKLTKKVEEGVRPFYRMADWQQYERDIGKKLKKKSWYGKEVETVVFVQATPEEVLKR